MTIISKITSYLLPTEKILWHKLPEPKAPSKGKAKFVPIRIGSILVILFSLLLIHSALSRTTQTTILPFYFTLIAVGLILIGVGIAPVVSSNTAKNIEIIITNQRVLIYPSPWAEKNRPKIINLYEVNGEIKMKYNKATDTGSIWIPTPHWHRFGSVTPAGHNRPTITQSRMVIFGKPIVDPDIEGIKEPHKVYDILVEAIATGKSTNWK